MTQSLPITPAALTKRARTILGVPNYGGVTSRKDGADAVMVQVGPAAASRSILDEYVVRQRKLIEELTAEGYLAEPVGRILVRVQRAADVERRRQEILAAGARDAARVADVVASLGGSSSLLTPAAHVATGNAYQHEADPGPIVGATVPGAARPLPELVAEARAILAEIEPDAGDVAAVTEDLPEHLRGDLDLIRRLALSRGSAYAQGWNDGHSAGLDEADHVLFDVRSKVQALKARLWEDGDPADQPADPEVRDSGRKE